MENTDDMVQNAPASSSTNTDNDQGQHAFAGFWCRSFAFILDLLLLGTVIAVITALAELFFNRSSIIGEWGRVIGFLIGALYFGLMEGASGRTQSLGKRAMQIRVVRCTANGFVPLSFFQAIARYAIVAIPLVLGGRLTGHIGSGNFYFTGSVGFSDIPVLRTAGGSFVVDLWYIVLLYLLIFNWPTRQSLHDLAVSSLVVPVQASHAQAVPVKRKHWLVLGILGMLIAIYCLLISRMLSMAVMNASGMANLGTSSMADLTAIQRATAAIPGVRQSTVSINTTQDGTTSQGFSQTTSVTIVVQSNDPALRSEQGALAVVQKAFAVAPDLSSVDEVKVVYGGSVDLGIAAFWYTQFVESESPSDWKTLMVTQSDTPNQ